MSSCDVEMKILIKKIAALSGPYKLMFENTSLSYKEVRSHEKIRDDWMLSLINFFDRVFYQGRRDTVSGQFEKATVMALKDFFKTPQNNELMSFNKKGLLNWKNYGYNVKGPIEGAYSVELYNCLRKKYDFVHNGKIITSGTGKQRDRAMVVDSLRYLSALPDYNILHYAIDKIKLKKLAELEKELRCIRQIGKKTCSLYLRDTVSFYNLEKCLVKPSDYDLLQPVDTWVHQMAQKLDIIDEKMSLQELEKNRNLITEAALNAGVSPIKFNQGLWYLPTHAVDLLLDAYRK